MNLLLQRTTQSEISTQGELFVNGAHECWTLEPPDPIPAGRYRITMYESPKFHRFVPLLHDVPGHTYIEIHSGYSPADTKDCILVGVNKAPDRVLNGHIAENHLSFKISKALTRGGDGTGEEVWIDVQDVGDGV